MISRASGLLFCSILIKLISFATLDLLSEFFAIFFNGYFLGAICDSARPKLCAHFDHIASLKLKSMISGLLCATAIYCFHPLLYQCSKTSFAHQSANLNVFRCLFLSTASAAFLKISFNCSQTLGSITSHRLSGVWIHSNDLITAFTSSCVFISLNFFQLQSHQAFASSHHLYSQSDHYVCLILHLI